jgi:hypothetical protein
MHGPMNFKHNEVLKTWKAKTEYDIKMIVVES